MSKARTVIDTLERALSRPLRGRTPPVTSARLTPANTAKSDDARPAASQPTMVR